LTFFDLLVTFLMSKWNHYIHFSIENALNN